MADRFEAQVSAWVRKTEARMLAVFRDSVQDLFSVAQTTVPQGGDLPIDTGNLRNTFISGLNDGATMEGPDAYEFAVANAKIGDSVYGGWTAEYARRMEHGFVGTDSLGRVYNQQGFHFVANAAAQWQSIVDRNARRLRTLSG